MVLILFKFIEHSIIGFRVSYIHWLDDCFVALSITPGTFAYHMYIVIKLILKNATKLSLVIVVKPKCLLFNTFSIWQITNSHN